MTSADQGLAAQVTNQRFVGPYILNCALGVQDVLDALLFITGRSHTWRAAQG